MLKNILFFICIITLFTAQTYRPDDKGQKHVSVSRPSPVRQNNQGRPQVQKYPQVQSYHENHQQIIQRTSPAESHQYQPVRQQWGAPRVYAVAPSSPAQNNRLFHREHHNNWRPRYNFFENQYHFYPYVNIATTVELSSGAYSVVGPDGQTYFYDQGTFYLQGQSGQYVAVPPIVGIIVNPIAPEARQITVGDQIFYRYKGVFYVQVAQGYQVISPVQPASADQ